MRKIKFKSLTMRIWTTFTLVILVIILCLSFFYGYVFRIIDTNAKMQDLSVAHDILLESEYKEPMRFNMLRNLQGVSHFVIHAGRNVAEVGRPPGSAPGGGRLQGGNPPSMGASRQNAPMLGDMEIRNWIAEFAVGDMSKKEFRQGYNGIDYIFIISTVNNDEYFISYMPNFYDNSLLYYMLAIGGMFIAVGFIAAKIVANYLSKPLSALEKFTVRIAAKDWKESAAADMADIMKSNDEIGRLAASMDKMREDLKRADDEEKMFLQSISHDLKTPVMVIMSHADAIIDGVYVDTLDKTVQIIKDEAIRLNNKIKQLLYLNTLDYVLGNQSEISSIKLDVLIGSIAKRFEILGGRLNWVLDIEEATVKGNEDKLTVAIENILDNALRYAKSEIAISLKANERVACLELFNDGEPIDSKMIDKIFDNMYNKVNIHKDKTGNFGLGLAITKKIIAFFGGTVYACNKENGVSFVIELPVE